MTRLVILLLLLGRPLLAAAKPNIIVIFTDDLGYADLACQGHEKDVFTPNLASEHPGIFAKLRAQSDAWAATLQPAGAPHGKPVGQEIHWYQEYFKVQLDQSKP